MLIVITLIGTPIQNQASGRNMESYLPVYFLTLAVSLPLGLNPEKKGQGITSLNGPCLHQIYIGQCDRIGFVWLDQKSSANTVKIVPMQECWWKTPIKLLAVSLTLSCAPTSCNSAPSFLFWFPFHFPLALDRENHIPAPTGLMQLHWYGKLFQRQPEP